MKNIKEWIIALAIAGVFIMVKEWDNIENLLSKPKMELSKVDSGYQLCIDFFKFNGAYNDIQEKIYNKLKGKSGKCKIFIKPNTVDNYGNEAGKFEYVGQIDIDALNKYQNYYYWVQRRGQE